MYSVVFLGNFLAVLQKLLYNMGTKVFDCHRVLDIKHD